jgi:hypothetical protein
MCALRYEMPGIYNMRRNKQCSEMNFERLETCILSYSPNSVWKETLLYDTILLFNNYKS